MRLVQVLSEAEFVAPRIFDVHFPDAVGVVDGFSRQDTVRIQVLLQTAHILVDEVGAVAGVLPADLYIEALTIPLERGEDFGLASVTVEVIMKVVDKTDGFIKGNGIVYRLDWENWGNPTDHTFKISTMGLRKGRPVSLQIGRAHV